MTNPRYGRCVHCLADNVVVTDDHVLPDSWYPPNTPGTVARWVAPACKPCDHALETPRFMFFHYCGKGKAVDLARAVKNALNTQQSMK
jgi:hypothetical protein